MTDLPKPEPYLSAGRLPESDLRAFLVGVEPGWYRSRDLHPRYVEWAKSQDKTPVNVKTLGEALGRVLKLERRQAHGHISVWRVTEELSQP